MRTITFYSYKGGVGRTLVVANVARYLARFGQRVFAIDFDLEAPGLHYKLGLDNTDRLAIERGLVDYIHAFAVGDGDPGRLADYVIELPKKETAEGSITLMPAGAVPSQGYWQKLAQIHWHDCFYAPGARGIPFFLELKERIAREFRPDFLLLDSRTGITEIGGIATTLLPDQVVCLLLNNRENLDGARAVLRSLRRTPRLKRQRPIDIVPVVTRLPELDDPAEEHALTAEVHRFLTADAEDLAATLATSEILVLHSEPELQIHESLRVGGGKRPEESPLLRDYLRLFARLFPKQLLESYVGPLIQEAMAKALDDPDNAEKDLKALTAYTAHPEAHRALLKFYHLRREDGEVILRAAENFWRATGLADDPLLIDSVREYFSMDQPWRHLMCSGEMVEAVWRTAEESIDLGLDLARLYLEEEKPRKAADVLHRLLEQKSAGAGEPLLEGDRLLDIARLYRDLGRVDEFRAATVERFGEDAIAELILRLDSVD